MIVAAWAFFVSVVTAQGVHLTIDHEHGTEVQCGVDYADVLRTGLDSHVPGPHRVTGVGECEAIMFDSKYGKIPDGGIN